MVLYKKIIMWVVGLFLIFVAAVAVFVWLYGPTIIGYGLKSKVCTLTGGILIKSSCKKLSDDAYRPCSISEQCNYGCFVSASDSQLEKVCQYGMGEVYLCSPDIKLEGQCAPLDQSTLVCSKSYFLDKYNYQLVENGRVEPVFPFGLSYGCPFRGM